MPQAGIAATDSQQDNLQADSDSLSKGVVFEQNELRPAEELGLAAMEKGAKRALEKGKANRTIAEMAGLTQEEFRLGFADQFSRIREETATLSTQGKILE